jgi:hypothetical protein
MVVASSLSQGDFMKNAVKLSDWQEKNKPKKEEEAWVKLKPCCNCGKEITDGYYGRFQEGGVCSKACNAIENAKPKYGGQHAPVPCEPDEQKQNGPTDIL